MTPRRKRREDGGEAPRRGMRRSIRHEAVDTSGDDDERDTDARHDADRPPEVLLRKLKLAEALERLEFQLRAYASRGQTVVLVIHGKGRNSAGGVSVLGPEVRRWCDAHPSLVASWSEAPLRWGGTGAIVARLRRQ